MKPSVSGMGLFALIAALRCRSSSSMPKKQGSHDQSDLGFAGPLLRPLSRQLRPDVTARQCKGIVNVWNIFIASADRKNKHNSKKWKEINLVAIVIIPVFSRMERENPTSENRIP